MRDDLRDDGGTAVVPARRTLGFLLQDCWRLMRRRFVVLAREAGLPVNSSEANVLLHLTYGAGISQVALAAQLDIEPIALVRLLDRLQEAGLVERRPDRRDRRVRQIWLTPEAGPLIVRIRDITAIVRSEALSGFTACEREGLTSALLRVSGNLSGQE